MKDVLLYLKRDSARSCLIQPGSSAFLFQGRRYLLDCENFGEWMPFESGSGKIRGFLIIPIELTGWPDDYIKRRILDTDFIRKAKNVEVIQDGEYVYIKISLSVIVEKIKEGVQAPYVQIFHDQNHDIILCLRCFYNHDIEKIGFNLETEDIPVGV